LPRQVYLLLNTPALAGHTTVREAFPHTVGFVYLGDDAVGFQMHENLGGFRSRRKRAGALLRVVVLRSVRAKGG
jgi:hypothetical protein